MPHVWKLCIHWRESWHFFREILLFLLLLRSLLYPHFRTNCAVFVLRCSLFTFEVTWSVEDEKPHLGGSFICDVIIFLKNYDKKTQIFRHKYMCYTAFLPHFEETLIFFKLWKNFLKNLKNNNRTRLSNFVECLCAIKIVGLVLYMLY